MELVRKLLLQTLDINAIEARDTPEKMHSTWGRMQDVAKRREIRASRHAHEDGITIPVGFKEDLGDRGHRVSRPRAFARCDSVHAHVDVESMRVDRVEPTVKSSCEANKTGPTR